MARPVKYTPEVLEKINTDLEKYIQDTDYPIVAEFAYQNDIPRQKLYEFSELNDTIKKLIDKKESYLERGIVTGEINVTGGIFSLKQLGWKDRQEFEHKFDLSEKTTSALEAFNNAKTKRNT